MMVLVALPVYGQDTESTPPPTTTTTDTPEKPKKKQKVKRKQYNTNQYEDVLYFKEFTIGLKAHTNGFGLSANFIKIQNIFKRRVIEIEIMDLKHPKEKRSQSLFSTGRTSAKGYVFGKQNNFYNVNASFGLPPETIAEKGRKSGVAVSLYYAGGVSLGIAKTLLPWLGVQSNRNT